MKRPGSISTAPRESSRSDFKTFVRRTGTGLFQPPRPLDAANNSSDDETLSARIRQVLAGNKRLSLRALSITVRTFKGMVTLRGDVKSEAEKQIVLSSVAQLIPNNQLTEELHIWAR